MKLMEKKKENDKYLNKIKKKKPATKYNDDMHFFGAKTICMLIESLNGGSYIKRWL